MPLRSLFPFLFRLPVQGLIDHYEVIAKGMAVVEESFRGYLSEGGGGRAFTVLVTEMDRLEEEADKLKRKARYSLPGSLFGGMGKTLVLNYTRSQDDILDSAQDSLHWLSMRRMDVPDEFHDDLLKFLVEALETVYLLRPPLHAAIDFLGPKADMADRAKVKEGVHRIRDQHHAVSRLGRTLVARIYNSAMDFKDIHQLIHVIESLDHVSHNAEGCAGTLRIMITR